MESAMSRLFHTYAALAEIRDNHSTATVCQVVFIVNSVD